MISKIIQKKSLLVRLLLSSALLVLLIVTVDLGDSGRFFAGIKFQFLILAFAVALVDRVLMAYKWNILLKAKKISLSLARATSIYMSSTFLGIFLPATVGADAIRALAVYKRGHRSSEVISSILIERLIGLLALMVLALVGVALSAWVFGPSLFTSIRVIIFVIAAMMAVLLLVSYLSLNRSLLKTLMRIFIKILNRTGARRRVQGLQEKIEDVYRSYKGYENNRPTLLAFFALSLLETVFPILWTYLLALAYGIQIPFAFFFILMPIVLVLVRIPVSLDGFGVQEGTFVYMLGTISIAAPEALFLGLASHLVALSSVLPGGVMYAVQGLSGRKNQPSAGDHNQDDPSSEEGEGPDGNSAAELTRSEAH